MKSTEFVTEGAGKERIANWAEIIKRDCQPYIQKAQPFSAEDNLLRGMRRTKEPFIKSSIRLDNRKPKDIPQELHSRINQYFKQHYGGEFRNALFTTSDYIQAENYGNVYYIFPIGDFKFLWSPDVEDLFMNYDDYAPFFNPFKEAPDPQVRKEKTDAGMDAFFDEEIVNGNWNNTDLRAGINSGMEVMIQAKGYYAVSLEAIKEEPKQFFRMLK